jgi:hypothetical protein
MDDLGAHDRHPWNLLDVPVEGGCPGAETSGIALEPPFADAIWSASSETTRKIFLRGRSSTIINIVTMTMFAPRRARSSRTILSSGQFS